MMSVVTSVGNFPRQAPIRRPLRDMEDEARRNRLKGTMRFNTVPSDGHSFDNHTPGGFTSDLFPHNPTSESNVNAFVRRASAASVAVLFGLLIWRSLSSYELADQFSSAVTRTLLIVPVVVLLVVNTVGLLVSIVKPLNFKNQLKAVLALNILREWTELAYNIVMILLASSRSAVPREAYVGRIFMNIWWSILCFSFSKSRWVLSAPSAPRQEDMF